MPLGGLLPYDDEEERRRRMLTPPTFSRPALPPPELRSPLPAPAVEESMPLPTRGAPGMLPPPDDAIEFSRPTRTQRFESEKDAFTRATPGRGKSALSGALEGFLGGGGLLGAATGAVYGATDPRGLREQQFNRRVRPGLMERFAMEDMDAQRARQAEEDQLNSAYKTAQIGELNRRGLPEPVKPRSPVRSDRGLYDPDSDRIIPGTEPLPAPPRQPAPNFEFDVDRLPYDLNNPSDRKRYEGLPRSKRVKPEKAGTGKPKEKQKFVPLSKIREYAKQKGISRDQAEAEARADGYTIVR